MASRGAGLLDESQLLVLLWRLSAVLLSVSSSVLRTPLRQAERSPGPPVCRGSGAGGVAARCWRRLPGAPRAAPQASAWSDPGSLPQLPLPGFPWRGPGPGGLTSFLQGGSLSAALSLPQERDDGPGKESAPQWAHHLSLSHGWLSSSSRTPGQPAFGYGSRCCSWRGCNWRCPHHTPPQAPR